MANQVLIDNTERWDNDIGPRLLSILEECQAAQIPFVFSCNYVVGTETCSTQTYQCVPAEASETLLNVKQMLQEAAGRKNDG